MTRTSHALYALVCALLATSMATDGRWLNFLAVLTLFAGHLHYAAKVRP
ncbi:hypothetical protein ACWDN6_14615 [Streptomyces albogriseolus]